MTVWTRVNPHLLKPGDRVRWRGGAVGATKDLDDQMVAFGSGEDVEVVSSRRTMFGHTVVIRFVDGTQRSVAARTLICGVDVPGSL